MVIDADQLADLFAAIDHTYFHPHPLSHDEAERIATYRGRDVYLVHDADGRAVAYGMLRGWDLGYEVPSLGVAVRTDAYGLGHGRRMMAALHEIARQRGSRLVRLRVHPDNARARALYRSMGYVLVATERGEDVMVLVL